MKKVIAYYRVSTKRQGISGLGLEAQQQSVRQFIENNSSLLLDECVEIESGRKSNRPVLLSALKLCKQEKATLLIAKLDRLGRSVAFISTLMESKVEFLAVDNPNASKVVVHVMAAMAENERDLISKRTKEALQVAKHRGKQLGQHALFVLSKKDKQAADDFAAKMQPVIDSLKAEGFQSIRALTDILNERKIQTYSGHHCKWHRTTVHSLLKRINIINQTQSIT